MSKIEELKKKIIQEGMTDEDFEQFKVLLRRTPGDFLKNQHCYTTAVSLSKENADQAIRLIEYGLETFSDDDLLGKQRAYTCLADVYYKINQYNKAYSSLKKAQGVAATEGNRLYVSCEMDMLWMKMHVDSFEYSEELEVLYSSCQKECEFTKALLNNQFKMTVAEIIIMLHHGRKNQAVDLYNKAVEMTDSEYKGALAGVLKKHKASESLDITEQAFEYLKSIQKILEQ